MKLSFRCTDWRRSGRSRLMESLTAGSFQQRIMAAVFLFSCRKLLTTSLSDFECISSTWRVFTISTNCWPVLVILKPLASYRCIDLKDNPQSPNFIKCGSCEKKGGSSSWWLPRCPWMEKANGSCVHYFRRWTMKLSFTWDFCDFLFFDQVAHFPSDLFAVMIPEHKEKRQSFSLMNTFDTRGRSN